MSWVNIILLLKCVYNIYVFKCCLSSVWERFFFQQQLIYGTWGYLLTSNILANQFFRSATFAVIVISILLIFMQYFLHDYWQSQCSMDRDISRNFVYFLIKCQKKKKKFSTNSGTKYVRFYFILFERTRNGNGYGPKWCTFLHRPYKTHWTVHYLKF